MDNETKTFEDPKDAEIEFLKAAAEQASRRAEMFSKITQVWELLGTEVFNAGDDTMKIKVSLARQATEKIVEEYGT